MQLPWYGHVDRHIGQVRKREAVGNKILKGKFWLDHEELRMSGLGV